MTTHTFGIADVSERTGLTPDTLRWYEREGLVPRVPRGRDGRRAYDDASLRILMLIVRLRRTGMPVAEVRDFCQMVEGGAASHGRRMALLRDHRVHLLAQLAQLEEDLAAVEDKIDHYARLIEHGLDCADQPIADPRLRTEQGKTR